MMSILKIVIICFLNILMCFLLVSSNNITPCNNLHSVSNKTICVQEKIQSKLYIFHSIKITLQSNDQFTIRTGDTEDAVSNIKRSWLKILYAVWQFDFSNQATAKKRHVEMLRLSPYKTTYVCIDPLTQVVGINVKNSFEPTCFLFLFCGILLFFKAKQLSKSVTFYYSSSVGIGIIASLLILVFILSKFVPKKPAAYSILLGGWSICVWIFTAIWKNFETLVLEYKIYFIAYIVVMGFLSFAGCYWVGPVENDRTQTLVQWFLQIIALFLLINSSQLIEVSIIIISLMLFFNLNILQNIASIPLLKKFSFQNVMYKLSNRYPPVQKLLSEEEFRKEGEIETKKALEELRRFCNSPQCSPWKTVRNLRKPVKFASFIDGEDDMDDTEVTLYDGDYQEDSSTSNDSDSRISEDENSLAMEEKLKVENNDLKDNDDKETDWNAHISEDEDSLVKE